MTTIKKSQHVKRSSTVFLKLVLVLIGIGTIALLLWEPHLEGRNVNATLFEMYFKDPFLAYIYMGSIPFFVALYQAFKLLGYIERSEVFSQPAVKTLRTIKYCGLTIITLLVGAEGYIVIVQRKAEEDIAGGVAVGIVIIFLTIVITTAAAVFEKTLQSAVDIKSENDLTV